MKPIRHAEGMDRAWSSLELRVIETTALCDAERRQLLGLFQANYRQANRAYLEKSLARLRYVALAVQGRTPIGFALGETRLMDLPRLPAQGVSLAGICCIAARFRRHGLFRELERRVLTAGAIPARPRRLICGRMAHPAAMRAMARTRAVVPKPGVPPTPWQQAVGKAIAEAYGAPGFDPATFVCIGDGRPIGYPRIQFEAEPHEWQLFKPVNRDRGDALLALGWGPDAPPSW